MIRGISMNEIKLSVIICTHNPKADLLARVLEALKGQSLPLTDWELLLIDSASASPVDLILTWHPNFRIERMEEPGLTRARLAGFTRARAPWLVLVDDDNLLAPDFLSEVVKLRDTYPQLGVMGSSIEAEYLQAPPEWLREEAYLLAIRPVNKLVVAEDGDSGVGTPAGAGMVLRREVAEAYADSLATDPIRNCLDRRGGELTSAGDTDLARFAWDLGFSIGHFPTLRLKHVIPPGRITEDYITRLHEGMAYSGTLLKYVRGDRFSPDGNVWLKFRRFLRNWLKLNARQRRFASAHSRGVRKALAEIHRLRSA